MSSRFETPAIPPEFIIKEPRSGKPYITAPGLVYLGHLQNLKRVTSEIVHLPTKDDPMTVVRCEVETDLGVFSDYGTFSAANAGTVKNYPVEMASTRARNRALRIATGCPIASYEELGMDDDPAERPAPVEVPRPAVQERDEGQLPAPESWYPELRGLIAQLRQRGEVVGDPKDKMTRTEARDMKKFLTVVLGQYQAAEAANMAAV